MAMMRLGLGRLFTRNHDGVDVQIGFAEQSYYEANDPFLLSRHEKSERLLVSILTRQQRNIYRRYGLIAVEGSGRGIYVIDTLNAIQNIFLIGEISDHGQFIPFRLDDGVIYCVTSYVVPKNDVIAAQVLMIETDEELLLSNGYSWPIGPLNNRFASATRVATAITSVQNFYKDIYP